MFLFLRVSHFDTFSHTFEAGSGLDTTHMVLCVSSLGDSHHALAGLEYRTGLHCYVPSIYYPSAQLTEYRVGPERSEMGASSQVHVQGSKWRDEDVGVC